MRVTKPYITQIVEVSPGVLNITWDKEDSVFTFALYYSLSETDYKRRVLSDLLPGENLYSNQQSLGFTGYSNILSLTLTGLGIPYREGEVLWFWLTATNSNTDIEGPFSQGYAIRLMEAE